jgi:hypothetical protein
MIIASQFGPAASIVESDGGEPYEKIHCQRAARFVALRTLSLSDLHLS